MEEQLMKIPDICPRCATNWIPCNEHPGEYPGAISRADNETEICSACGNDEAMQDYTQGGCTPVKYWPLASDDSQDIDGGGNDSGIYLGVEFGEDDGNDVLARFTDQSGDKSITIVTAPRATINGDGPLVTQTSSETIIVVLSDEFVTDTMADAIAEYEEVEGAPTAAFGMAFILSAALRAVEDFFNDSL